MTELLYGSTLSKPTPARLPRKQPTHPGRKVTKLGEVQNTKFYVIKLVGGDHVLHAVRKTDYLWQSRKVRNILSVYFADDQLGLNEHPGFNISRDVDFFIFGDDVIIMNKPAFEFVLSYKEAHAQDFQMLQDEAILSLLSTPRSARRIRRHEQASPTACLRHPSKGALSRRGFHDQVAPEARRMRAQPEFRPTGGLVPTPESCADIIRALLDHRLSSLFSQKNYDVPDATVVL